MSRRKNEDLALWGPMIFIFGWLFGLLQTGEIAETLPWSHDQIMGVMYQIFYAMGAVVAVVIYGLFMAILITELRRSLKDRREAAIERGDLPA